jgi:hypothetical protein
MYKATFPELRRGLDDKAETAQISLRDEMRVARERGKGVVVSQCNQGVTDRNADLMQRRHWKIFTVCYKKVVNIGLLEFTIPWLNRKSIHFST